MARAGRLPGGDDDVKRLLDSLPKRVLFDANRRMQKSLLAKHQERLKAEEKRAAAQERVQREVEETAEEEAAVESHAAEMARLRKKLTLGASLEEFQEHEAVLVALPRPEEPANCDLDAGYMEGVEGAAAALGLDLALEAATADQQKHHMLQDIFRSGLRSGFVRNQVLQKGAAGAPLVQALLETMTRSPDAETAGAAFVTLMALMADAGGSGSSAAASSGGGGSEMGEGVAGCLMLDAHYGLPAAAPGMAPPAVRLDCLPTDAQLLKALRDNGYRPGGKGSSGRGSKLPQEKQLQEVGGAREEEQEGLTVRLQSTKLILRTTAAVCRYCRKHPKALATTGMLSREGLSELLLAAVHVGLDTAANQLQQDLDAAAVALLGAFAEEEWQCKLPQLAERLAEMGPSNAARLKLLKKLPTRHPRGLALQQFAATILLECMLPTKQQDDRPAVKRRKVAALDPAAVIAVQPWFSDPKGLVAGATSGGAHVLRGGYMIALVELLLKVCHLLLWPHMLTFAQDEPSCMTAAFLDAWLCFLVGCQKHIKNMQPEDQAVKVLATYLELEYRTLYEADMAMGP